MSKAMRGVLLFTGIEVAVLIGWLILAGLPFNGRILAAVVLAGGIFVEHYVSVNVGAGRAPFGPLPPDSGEPDQGVPRGK